MKTSNKYINEIITIYKKYALPSGMGGFGAGMDAQRKFYASLPPFEKSKYEDAILELCDSGNVKDANIALNLASELANLFSNNWKARVTILLEKLVDKGLRPAYKGTISYAVLNLIIFLDDSSFVPFTKVFVEQVKVDFKQGILPLSEWELLYAQASKILIKLSADDFWKEFSAFYGDTDLLNRLGAKSTIVILPWSSFGALCYGLEWLRKFVIEYSTFPERELRAQALECVVQSSSIVISMNPSKREEVKGTLRWAKETLII